VRIIIVGAGIVGASAAFHLTEFGAEVYLIENDAPGRATFAGAGIVCPWLSHNTDPRYEAVAFAAARYYPELVTTLAAAGENAVDYGMVGGLVVGEFSEQLNPVAARLQRYLDRGIKEVGQIRSLKAGGPKELFPYLDPALAGIYLSGAARVSGESFRLALLNAALKAGARKIAGPAVLQRSDHAVVGVDVNGEFIGADAVIVAAGAWSTNLCQSLGLDLGIQPQRGQILHLRVQEMATETLPLIIPVLSEYYMLGFPESRVVMGATREDGLGFDFRATAGGVAEVLREGLRIAPGLKTATLLEIRVGFRPMSKDGLPSLGRPSGMAGLVIATGLGRYGLTVGPYAGRLAAQIAIGEVPEIDVSDFAPDRICVAADYSSRERRPI
jgi:D-amino-acid dehydrogenase